MKELIFHRHFVPASRYDKTHCAVIDGTYSATRDIHANRVSRLTHALRHELRLQKQDRFAVLARNSHAYVELYHAAFLGAGVITPLNLRLSAKELGYIICDSGAEVIFVDRHFSPLLEAARKTAENWPIRKSVLIGDGDVVLDGRYEDLLNSAAPALPKEPEEEDIAVLMYTGGTTGLPKGVILDQRALILNMYHQRIARPTQIDRPVALIQTPMFHAASLGTILSTYVMGGATVIVPAFEPELVLKEIERNKVTATLMVPTMIGMLLSHQSYKPERLNSVRQLIYGASPMPEVLLAKLLADAPQINLFQGYGMTESSASLTSLSADDHRRGGKRLHSVGLPVPGVELSIRDEAGNEVDIGDIGEVCAKGGNFMTGYWNKADATEEAFRGGWYHTGDAGYLDEDGYLFLVDRVKDMIISGGENIYSVEVENAIADHPAISQVAVIGIPDDTWGEAVHAVVVLKDGADTTEEEIMAHARKTIAGYKVPKSISFRTDPLPLSGAMKVLKRDLRAPFWQRQDNSIS